MAHFPGFPFQNQERATDFLYPFHSMESTAPNYNLFPQPEAQDPWNDGNTFPSETSGEFEARAPGEPFQRNNHQEQSLTEISSSTASWSQSNQDCDSSNKPSEATNYVGAPIVRKPRVRQPQSSTSYGYAPPYPPPMTGYEAPYLTGPQYPCPQYTTPGYFQPPPFHPGYNFWTPRPPQNGYWPYASPNRPEFSSYGPYIHHQPIFDLPQPMFKLMTPVELSYFGMFRGRICVAVCYCSFTPDGANGETFVVVSEPGFHVEVKALKTVRMLENRFGVRARKIVLICSFSPCARCTRYIIDFVQARDCLMDIWFTKIYRHTEEVQITSLQTLANFVRMSVTNSSVWTYLIDCTNFAGNPTSPRLNPEECVVWDIIWSSQLSAILQGNKHKIKRLSQMLYQKDRMMKNPVSAHYTVLWYKFIFNLVFANVHLQV